MHPFNRVNSHVKARLPENSLSWGFDRMAGVWWGRRLEPQSSDLWKSCELVSVSVRFGCNLSALERRYHELGLILS